MKTKLKMLYYFIIIICMIIIVFFIVLFVIIARLHNTETITLTQLGQLGDTFGVLTSLFTGCALLFTVAAFVGLIWNIKLQRQTLDEQIKISKQRYFFDFHRIWENIDFVDTSHINLNICNFVKVVNNLSLTALIWNNEIMEHKIMLETFGRFFMDHYERLDNSQYIVDLQRESRSYLTPDIKKTYDAIKKELT
ncbi:MAG: hypothetical protein GY730_02905 [bacterium]|nr:hypothetical protein [bacterium]